MGKIALFGAAGALGQSIAAALRAQHREYRVVGRSRSGLEHAFAADPLAEIVTWNPDDPASVRAAAENIETIVYLVGVPYDQFAQHPVVMRQTLDGAIAAGVKKMLLAGTVYPYGLPRSARVREDHARDPHTFKGKMRKAQEDLLLAADSAGLIRGTVLRLPDFYGPEVEKSFLHGVFAAALKGRQAQLIGPIDAPHEFVYVPDAGPIILALSELDGAFGAMWNFAGPGVTTQREMAHNIFAAAGHKPKLLVANKLMLRAMGLFDPLMRELVEMHYLQTDPVLMDDSALHALLGNVHKTSYEEGIARTLDSLRANELLAS